GQTGLIVTVTEKVYGPPILQPGFEVDGSETQDVTFTQAARFTFMDVAGYRSEWRTDVLFGNSYGISSELYRPFSALSKWFAAPHVDASDTSLKVYSKNDPIAIYRLDRVDFGLDFGYGFNRFAEVRVGYQIGYSDLSRRLGTPPITPVSGRVGDARLR